jgi:hypothetical protein
MHFNILNLRDRASDFSRPSFRVRMTSVLQRISTAGGPRT